MFGIFRRNRQFLYSVSVLIGSTVGVGIFGLPFVFAKTGFWVSAIYFVSIGAIMLLINLMYGEIILRTKEQHQIVGYTGYYLGSFFKKIIFFSVAFSAYAALLAYIIVIGEFLSNVFYFIHLTPSQYSYFFFAIFACLILIGIRRISWIEFTLTLLFISVILIIFTTGYWTISSANFPDPSPYYWFLPYGVIIFAFSGFAGIPIQREVLVGKERLFKKSIITGMFMISVLYFIFAYTVVGISGDSTTPDAIRGLHEYLGDKIIFLGSLFGSLAIGTSFLMLGSALKELFELDYGINKFKAWLLSVFPPIVLFIGGIRTFVDVIGIAGSIALALEMTILGILYIRAKSKGNRQPEYHLSVPIFFIFLLVSIFIAGIAYTLIK